MFAKVGIWQLVIIFGVFMLLFGYKKVPELGKTLGHSIRNFRRSLNEPDEIDITSSKSTEKEKSTTKE